MMGSAKQTALCFFATFGFLAPMALTGCAASTDAPAGDEATAKNEEAILCTPPYCFISPGVELKLQATLTRVHSTTTYGAIKEEQYLGFHVTNVGSNNAVASQLIVSCTLTDKLDWTPQCETPMIVGIPAIPAGGFFDYSYPTRAIEIGAGTDNLNWSPQGMSLSESITAQIVSPQYADPAIGTVTLSDSCSGYDACAATPAAPSPPPGGAGVVGTPIGAFTYWYTAATPTQIALWAAGPDGKALGSTPVYGGETVSIQALLETPYAGWSAQWSEPVQIQLDGNVVATTSNGAAQITLPPYDTKTHTLKAVFPGDGQLVPTVSRTISFTLSLPIIFPGL